MQCPERGSTNISKNGHRRGKQNHICADCQRQFLDHYQPLGYADDVRQECLKMYVNGMGFRGIEWVKRVHHTTVITWVRSENAVLLKVRRDAGSFHSTVNPLLKIW